MLRAGTIVQRQALRYSKGAAKTNGAGFNLATRSLPHRQALRYFKEAVKTKDAF